MSDVDTHGATVASDLLERLRAKAAEIADAEHQLADLYTERDELIRAAMRTDLRRPDIAAAASLKEARLYQIRDGRR